MRESSRSGKDSHLAAGRYATPQVVLDATLEDREPVVDRPVQRVAVERALDERRSGRLVVDEAHDPGRIAVSQKRAARCAEREERFSPRALEESPHQVSPKVWIAEHASRHASLAGRFMPRSSASSPLGWNGG